MRNNGPVTNKQLNYNESQKIVSTTDEKGILLDVNDDFVSISGFTREELIGQAHNLVRHPWMPQEAFAELWQHNKQSKLAYLGGRQRTQENIFDQIEKEEISKARKL